MKKREFLYLSIILNTLTGGGRTVIKLIGPDGILEEKEIQPRLSSNEDVEIATIKILNRWGLKGWRPSLVNATGSLYLLERELED